MALWLPFAIQGGEALVTALLAGGAAYAATHSWSAAGSAALAGLVGKVLPAQVTGPK